jgi:hypothetical protein
MTAIFTWLGGSGAVHSWQGPATLNYTITDTDTSSPNPSTACWMMLTCHSAARRVPGSPAESSPQAWQSGQRPTAEHRHVATGLLGDHCSFLAVRCDAGAPSAARRLPRPRRSPASRRAAKGWRWALVAIHTLSCGGAYRGYPVRMDFALATALKDAGFPQSGKGGHAGPPHKIV